MKRFFGFICLLFLAASTLFCVSVDDFLLSKQIVLAENEPLFSDNKITLTADDGTKIVLMQVNPYYTPENENRDVKGYYDSGYEKNTTLDWIYYVQSECMVSDRIPERFRSYLLLDETEKQILYKFDDIPEYMTTHADSIKIEKGEEFENAVCYNFTYLKNDYFSLMQPFKFEVEIKPISTEHEVFWLGKGENTDLSGSFKCPPKIKEEYPVYLGLSYRTEEGAAVYKKIKDIYLYFVNKELDRCDSLLAVGGPDLNVSHSIHLAERTIIQLDKEYGRKLQKRLEEMHEKQSEVLVVKKFNESFVRSLVSTVSGVKYDIPWLLKSLDNELNSDDQYYVKLRESSGFEERKKQIEERIGRLKEFENSRPNIQEELPQTEDELVAFLEWRTLAVSLVRPSFVIDGKIVDWYKTEVKFELIDGRLKVSSAGYDCKFDTADDFVYDEPFIGLF